MNKVIITTFSRLKDYALWYYFKYLPSINKLENKLLEKTMQNRELVEQVFEDIKDLFQEEQIIESKVKVYLFFLKPTEYLSI